MRKMKKLLFLSVEQGDIEVVRELLSGGLGPNIVNNATERITPLMVAVKVNNVPMIRLLLEFNANAESMDFAGRDAFDYADKFQSHRAFFTLLRYANMEEDSHAG